MQPVPSHGAPTSTSGDMSGMLLDQLTDGVWALDADSGMVLMVNRAAAASMGAVPADLVGASFPSIASPPLSTEGWRLLLDHADSGRHHRIHTSLSTPSGPPVPVELEISRHPVAQQDLVTVVSRRAPAAADPDRGGSNEGDPSRNLGDRVQQAFAVLGTGLAVVDPDGRIDHVNDSFCALVGRTSEQILHRSALDPPWSFQDEQGHDVSPGTSPLAECLTTGKPATGDVCSVAVSRSEQRFFRMSAKPLPSGGAVVMLEDLTSEMGRADEIRTLRDCDELTGLGNRRWILESLADTLADEEVQRVGVLHLDLDGFHNVNDTFGPVVGDAVLLEIADRIRDLGDRRVCIGRIGVDEILLVVTGAGPGLAFDGELRRLADELQRRLHAPVAVDGLEIRLSSSVGVARSPGDASTAEHLSAAARRALIAGRSDGSSRIRFYEPDIDAATRTGLALDRELRMAAAARQLEVHYQPIIDLRTGAVAMAEALVRWHHPEEGPISPAVFIPTAEATGSIGAVSDLVISTVARDVATWTREGTLPAGARIAINISPTEFEQRDFTERLATTLAAEGVSPSQLELEITESLLVQDLRAAAARLAALDEMGFLIALDDFGTGYSSLSYLHTLPFHTLKIDRSVVSALRDDRSGTITRAILTLAHNLGIVAVAEGVETDGQRSFLTDAGCDLVQGFLYAPPLPKAAFERFLTDDGGVVQLPTPRASTPSAEPALS